MNMNGEIKFDIVEHSADRVVGTMPVLPGILNPFGVANAGAILWFADVCASVLAIGSNEVTAGAAGFPLGIGLNAVFLGNQTSGMFTATSEYVKKGRALSVVRTIVVGDDGRLVADVTTSHTPSK